MSENKESCDCRRVKLPREDGPEGETQPGDFAWDTDMPNATPEEKAAVERTLYLHIPGSSRWTAWPVSRQGATRERLWGWDGNEEKPTLTPSLHWVGRWHGHLWAGRLHSCP